MTDEVNSNRTTRGTKPQGLPEGELPADFAELDLAGAAVALARAGFHVFPAKDKEPFDPATGRPLKWTTAATTDTQTIVSWFAGAREGELQVAVACGPSGLVVVDEDHPNVLQAEWLPRTLVSITRTDRLQWWYRTPPGRTLGNSTGDLPSGFGDIRGSGGYVIAPPSVHHETGKPYRFADPTVEVALLPDEIESRLPDATLSERPATDTEVQAFIDAHTENRKPQALRGILARTQKKAGDGHEHSAAVDAVPWALREARAGHFPAQLALDTLESWFVNALATRSNPREPGPGEWRRIVTWGVAQAMAEPDERIAEIRAEGDEPDIGELFEQPTEATSAEGDGRRRSAMPVLPAEFWETRDTLRGIRQAAHHRQCSPDALLGAVLARTAAINAHTIKTPPTPSPVGLTTYVALIGRPGMGKSAAARVAQDLVPLPASVVEVPSGSGEGLVEVLIGTVEVDAEDGKKRRVRQQVRHNVFIAVDEGSQLIEIGQRQGSTATSVIRTAWTDGVLGNANASEERKRIVPGGQYVYGLVIGFQPSTAGPLLDMVADGTPQRFLWMATADPTAPDVAPEWPDGLTITPLDRGELDKYRDRAGDTVRHPLVLPEHVSKLVYARRRAALREELVIDEMDEHAQLLRIKVAALLALMEHRMEVSEEDWDLAGVIVDTSAEVRSYVQAELRAEAEAEEVARLKRQVRRDAASEAGETSRALASAAISVGRKVRKLGRATRRDLSQSIAGRHRKLVTVDDVIERAEADGTITRDGDHWVPGTRAA